MYSFKVWATVNIWVVNYRKLTLCCSFWEWFISSKNTSTLYLTDWHWNTCTALTSRTQSSSISAPQQNSIAIYCHQTHKRTGWLTTNNGTHIILITTTTAQDLNWWLGHCSTPKQQSASTRNRLLFRILGENPETRFKQKIFSSCSVKNKFLTKVCETRGQVWAVSGKRLQKNDSDIGHRPASFKPTQNFFLSRQEESFVFNSEIFRW